ncbi:hypothetical protein ALC57_02412 [Trachymyrmex cornetzi]|uniref:Uncharacterized protein n=1 Tax=Trachymyrmex cornetzi TaxID=471704 RepID=A0A151JNN7_9HYME|nr:hypothetical protein ALC57_02412 [Trachymyrmex cornetzi]
MDQELQEFLVLIDEKNEIITLFLNKEDMKKASQDSVFLRNLIAKEQSKNKNNNIEPVIEVEELINENLNENDVDKNDAAAMDSLFGDKASIRPPAITSSEGPLDPNQEESSSEKIVSSQLQSKFLYLCVEFIYIY